jgi:prophage regulatory protein
MIIHTHKNERILKLPKVKDRTGLGKSSVYAFEKEGKFPKRVSLGARSVGWLESEVDHWIETRIQQSRNGKNGGGL